MPLRRRPHLIDDAAESSSAETQQAPTGEGIDRTKKSLDPVMQKTLAPLRGVALSDRALHDSVRSVVHIAISYVRLWLVRGR
jgi:hypothetical protein